MFVDTGSLHQKRNFMIEYVRRKGREDGTPLPVRLNLFAGQSLPLARMIPLDYFNLLGGIDVNHVLYICDSQ